MLIFYFGVFNFIGLVENFLFDEHHSCTTDDYVLYCICKDKDYITITANMNLDIRLIKVEGCGIVDVPLVAIPNLYLEEVKLFNIDELNISPFAFAGIQALHTLIIENVQNFNVNAHGFQGLENVTNVIIKNVSSSSLVTHSFNRILNIETFRIEDSYFGSIEEEAFNISNVNVFQMENCRIDGIDSNAFIIHNASLVQFTNSYIGSTRNHSISLSFVDVLTFINLDFELIESHFINAISLQKFMLKGCNIQSMNSSSLSQMDVIEEITIVNNTIKNAEDFLLCSTDKSYGVNSLNIYTCCNFFTCDCNIYWMWEHNDDQFYKDLIASSSCLETNEKILSMQPVTDKKKNCISLEFRNSSNSIKVQNSVNSISTRFQIKTEFQLFIIFIGHILQNKYIF